MRKRVFRMLGVLLIAASLMLVTRQLIHVTAQPGPCGATSFTTDGINTPQVTTSTTEPSCPTPSAPAPNIVSCGFDIPSQAIVGAITVPSTFTFYAPNNNALISGVTLTKGSKWLAIGLNSTKQFEKIMIGCALAWIPVGAIGPSPDAPNAGAPLPTGIVSDSLSTPS